MPRLTEIAVVIPTLNAAVTLAETLACVRGAGEIVVVDGGSADGTEAIARSHGARVIVAARGRGSQIAAGVIATSAPWLLLHADTRPSCGCEVAAPEVSAAAGYFRFALDPDDRRARRMERRVAWRCRAFA